MKKFSYSKEFKKQMNNPLIQLYKIHLDNLHDCYIKELEKNKFLQEDIKEIKQKYEISQKININITDAFDRVYEDIVNICKNIIKYLQRKYGDCTFIFDDKFEKYFKIAIEELKKELKEKQNEKIK